MKISDLRDFETWLDSFLNFEKLPQKNLFWLDTMQLLCMQSGNPELSSPSIHVAGSKGKGSISVMISSILKKAGFKTGLYTSPHITNFTERITESNKPFKNEIYLSAANKLINIIEENIIEENEKAVRSQPARPVTWFELVTLFAFLCFKEAGTDFNVFEVGLGGRLDATNVIKPEICCIGPIESEHTEYLGDTLQKIAAEKGGIIKENTPVIVAEQEKSVKDVFRQIARQKNAPLLFIDEAVTEIKTEYIAFDSIDFDYAKNEKDVLNCSKKDTADNERKFNDCLKNHNFINDSGEKGNVSRLDETSDFHPDLMKIEISSPVFKRKLKTTLKLPGEFQAENAALSAIAVKIILPQIDESTIEAGLSDAYIQARFEIIKTVNKFRQIKALVLDGAHTVKSVTNTIQTYKKIFCSKSQKEKNPQNPKKPILLFACAQDKDTRDIAVLFNDFAEKIFLTIPGAAKTADLQNIKESFSSAGLKFSASDDFKSQIQNALSEAEKEKTVLLATGSFYLIAEVKKILMC